MSEGAGGRYAESKLQREVDERGESESVCAAC